MTSPFSWISMEEGFYSEKPYTNSEQIDLTLKLSPCGQNAEEKKMVLARSSSSMVVEEAKNTMGTNAEEEKMVIVRFGDLQTMRRVRTGKRLLMKKKLMAAAAEAKKSLPVSPAGGPQPLPHSIDNNFKTFANPCRDAWHEAGAGSNFQTPPKKENDSMLSSVAIQEMTPWPSDTMIERPAKKPKHVNSYQESEATDIVRQMPCVITTGGGTTGKRTEGLLYKYKRGQVCIVCVCHGSFLSPTEFVMHAGGKEVADPMKHITVCSDLVYINGDGAGLSPGPWKP
ncbi:hypothetical protein GLYMA_05G020400v4 [Glycine max]|uniref:ninja-family protein Os03g0419100 isoform X2 n=1 Tax=Glycine max TaxID=3847 RepID=UPI000294AC32|nr:ninja-family protein Os03g0419100 isoform X2 [Glycine max]KAG4390663.1 hypothetical protein GLYMA_05G020400v4 [Glycine max]